MRSLVKLAGLSLLVLSASSPATAATLIQAATFSATGLSGPLPNQSGSFTYSYDSVTFQNKVLLSIDFSIGNTVFDLTNSSIDNGTSGGALVGPGGPNAPIIFTNDFYLQLNNGFFQYTQASPFKELLLGSGRADITYQNSAVPEPATWAMMLLGFGGIGFSMRRKRTPVLARA